MHCLVVGNGESRRGVDISKFTDRFTIVGCNALHRDTSVDHLICCDRRMVEEAVISKHTINTKIYVREEWHKYFRKIKKDKRIHLLPEIPYEQINKQDKAINWGSGPYALLTAASLNPTTITMVGFDLYGIDNKVNNLYKDTNNYATRDTKSIDHSYWEHQIAKVFSCFPHINFYVYNRPDWKQPKRWSKPNVYFESFSLIKNLTFTK